MICGQVVIIEDWKYKLSFFIVHVILRGYFFITFYTMSFFIIPFFAIHLITTVCCCNLEIMKQCLNKVDEMKKCFFSFVFLLMQLGAGHASSIVKVSSYYCATAPRQTKPAHNGICLKSMLLRETCLKLTPFCRPIFKPKANTFYSAPRR